MITLILKLKNNEGNFIAGGCIQIPETESVEKHIEYNENIFKDTITEYTINYYEKNSNNKIVPSVPSLDVGLLNEVPVQIAFSLMCQGPMVPPSLVKE